MRPRQLGLVALLAAAAASAPRFAGSPEGVALGRRIAAAASWLRGAPGFEAVRGSGDELRILREVIRLDLARDRAEAAVVDVVLADVPLQAGDSARDFAEALLRSSARRSRAYSDRFQHLVLARHLGPMEGLDLEQPLGVGLVPSVRSVPPGDGHPAPVPASDARSALWRAPEEAPLDLDPGLVAAEVPPPSEAPEHGAAPWTAPDAPEAPEVEPRTDAPRNDVELLAEQVFEMVQSQRGRGAALGN